MILHTAQESLQWEEVNHHVLNRVTLGVINTLQAEILYYKNDELLIRTNFKIQEVNAGDKPVGLNVTSYAHIHPDVLRLEFSETKHIGDYETLEEAKEAAQTYFNHHYHPTYRHPH